MVLPNIPWTDYVEFYTNRLIIHNFVWILTISYKLIAEQIFDDLEFDEEFENFEVLPFGDLQYITSFHVPKWVTFLERVFYDWN